MKKKRILIRFLESKLRVLIGELSIVAASFGRPAGIIKALGLCGLEGGLEGGLSVPCEIETRFP